MVTMTYHGYNWVVDRRLHKIVTKLRFWKHWITYGSSPFLYEYWSRDVFSHIKEWWCNFFPGIEKEETPLKSKSHGYGIGIYCIDWSNVWVSPLLIYLKSGQARSDQIKCVGSHLPASPRSLHFRTFASTWDSARSGGLERHWRETYINEGPGVDRAFLQHD